MSLYYNASTLLTSADTQGGSFKSRIYNSKSLKASPAQIYALITEASKWDILLKDIIENSQILASEPKLTPLLCLLLVYDFLLGKNGIAAPASHPLRQAIERHKVRLKAELTKSRVRRGCASLQDLQSAIIAEKKALLSPDEIADSMYPRWVRINNVKSTLSTQMETTFKGYCRVSNLNELKSANQIYVDAHIPDLVALAPGIVDFSSSDAYKNGEIILQDKASCFPAYLLLGDANAPWNGDLVDGCAAPGNKTTHLASILAARQKIHARQQSSRLKIISMDASATRSKTLQKMVSVAGANKLVTVLAGQDFLALDLNDEQFESVSGLLLDPSCSGSGIIGRDAVPKLVLPEPGTISKTSNRGTKRKRPTEDDTVKLDGKQSQPAKTDDADTDRLVKLSNLQTHIVEHALKFPSATRVTYSTCSIHMLENECVVERVLSSEIAKRRGWRIMRRDEQPEGLQKWKHRGIKADPSSSNKPAEGGKGRDITTDLTEEQLDACLRCWPGDVEYTGGFFVAGFVRDETLAEESVPTEENGVQKHDTRTELESESEWEGFSD